MNMTVVDTYYDNRQVQSAGETVGLVAFFQSSKPGATHADPEVETARTGRRPVGWAAGVAASPPEFESRLGRAVLAEFLL